MTDQHAACRAELDQARAEISRLHQVIQTPTIESREREARDVAALAAIAGEVDRLIAAGDQLNEENALLSAALAASDEARGRAVSALAEEEAELERRNRELDAWRTAQAERGTQLDEANAEIERLRGILAFEESQRRPLPAQDVDTMNRQLVGIQGDLVTVMMPARQMTHEQALIHAAWLVAMAECSGASHGTGGRFAGILAKVRGT